jgi:hypothetical protein
MGVTIHEKICSIKRLRINPRPSPFGFQPTLDLEKERERVLLFGLSKAWKIPTKGNQAFNLVFNMRFTV